jgi:dTDP-4-dehydrorhamnose reductase
MRKIKHNQKKKIRMLLTGVSGLLGNNLAYYFKKKYEILGLYNLHPVTIEGINTKKCNLLNSNNINKIISEYNPNIIIHCASLTNIDKCEVDKNAAKNLNILATKYITKATIDNDLKLIFISTDSVYDGIKGNFSENDKIFPQNYYGLSKYEAELQILKKTNSLIFRTNLFGWNIQGKKSLGEWILNELIANNTINAFKDVYFSSIYTMQLARIIDISISKDLRSVYNCGSINACSKYEFALIIAEWFGFDKNLIIPISIDDFTFKAKRGKNLSLDTSNLQKALDYRLPTIDYSVQEFYRDYKCRFISIIS